MGSKEGIGHDEDENNLGWFLYLKSIRFSGP